LNGERSGQRGRSQSLRASAPWSASHARQQARVPSARPARQDPRIPASLAAKSSRAAQTIVRVPSWCHFHLRPGSPIPATQHRLRCFKVSF
jgi:hypothetical protein